MDRHMHARVCRGMGAFLWSGAERCKAQCECNEGMGCVLGGRTDG